jgi:hypothetical protein
LGVDGARYLGSVQTYRVNVPTKPAWDAHFDRLANDEVTNNYPGLGFLDLLLKCNTTIALATSYAKTGVHAEPDLVVDCVAGWVNAEVCKGATANSIEDSLGQDCRGHLVCQVANDVSDMTRKGLTHGRDGE